MPTLYLDFEVEVGHSVDHAHAIVVRSLAGQARHSAAFPFTDAELESHLLKLENAILRSAGRRRKNPTSEDAAVQSFGQRLFDFLLVGDALSLYRECHREAAAQGRGVRLKLNLQPPNLAALPWEFLYDPRRRDYLCLDPNTPLVRYTELPQTAPPLTVTPPLRILGVVADPTDLTRLDVAEEKARLHAALANLKAQGLAHLTWLDGQTALDLQRTLRRGPWHALHFVGHAGFDTQRDEGLIILTNERGQADPLYATQLARLLAVQRTTLRLVLLNACEGARGSQQDLFASTAATLIGGGIPAVLAMQYEITDGAALQFARTFYEALADNLPVDAAVADARNAIILRDRHSLEWGTPVLHMRAADGVLFAVAPLAALGESVTRRATPAPETPAKPDPTAAGEHLGQTEPGKQGMDVLEDENAVETPPADQLPLPTILLASKVLAMLYSDENSARSMVANAGINAARIDFSGRTIHMWRSILQEAKKTNKLADLMAIVMMDHDRNQEVAVMVNVLFSGGATRIEDKPNTEQPEQQSWNLSDGRILKSEATPPIPPALLANLREVLADLYTDEGSARRVLFDAGLNASRIDFSGNAVDNWHAILREAEKTGKLADLLAVVLHEYGENQPLQAVMAALGMGELLDGGKQPQPQTRNLPDSGFVQPTAQPPVAAQSTGTAAEKTAPTVKQPQQPASASTSQVRVKITLPIDLDWVTIPVGKFWMGSDKQKDKDAFDDELSQHELALPTYRITRTPVTYAQYKVFVEAAQHPTPRRWENGQIPEGKAQHPVTYTVILGLSSKYCYKIEG